MTEPEVQLFNALLLTAAKEYKRVWEATDEDYPTDEPCDWAKYPDGGDRWSHDMDAARETFFKIIEELS